jgi:DNA-binding SARP family transcriptional activator
MAHSLWWPLGESLEGAVQSRIYVLGRVEIETPAGLIGEQRFPGRQGRTLFAYLLCNRQRPLTREELANVLWPDQLPLAWETALHALVSKLRALFKTFAGPAGFELTAAFGTYTLRLSGDPWIDREAAAEAVDEAESLLREGDIKGAWAPGNIATIIARQPFLPGEEGEWLTAERRRLEDLLIRALECMAEVWLASGETKLALATARELITLEPYRETGYQRLMRFETATGNRAEALRIYETCRALLAEELGTDPSAETESLYLQLLGSP